MNNYLLGTTFVVYFNTDKNGEPFTLAGTPSVAVYKGTSTTEITAGLTLSVDLDTRTGFHAVTVVATSGNGFTAGSDYTVVLTAGTVDGTSVAGKIVGEFSIEHQTINADLRYVGGVECEDAHLTLSSLSLVSATTTALYIESTHSNAAAVTISSADGAAIELFAPGSLINFNDLDVASYILVHDWTQTIADYGTSAIPDRCLLNAARMLRNKFSTTANPGFVTVYEEDDTTEAYTKPITTDPDAEPIVSG